MNDTERDQIDWLRTHGPRLLLLARQWVTDQADAEDVLADVLTGFWQRRDHVRDPIAYVYRSVRRRAMNFKRDTTRRADALRRVAPSEPMFIGPDEAAEQGEQRERLHAAMSRLPTDQRELLVMRTWSELTFEQIGGVLDVPPRTAQSRHRAALEQLRRLMTDPGAI